jgi:hypothetical protein
MTLATANRAGRTALIAPVVLGLAVVGLAVAGTAPAATASALPVYDVSWPQCGQYGQPMPPTGIPGIVIGLTAGRAFTVNPCLATQVTWARAHNVPAQAYTMASYPTASQLTTYGSRGPWTGTSLAARLRNVGYAQARDARARLTAGNLGFAPSMIWIDVERNDAQPWAGAPISPAADRARNRAVLEGLMRGFSDAGIRYGIYADSRHVRVEVTGSWQLAGVPAWDVAGSAPAAAAACTRPGPYAGRKLMTQWTDGRYDYDVPCPGYTARPPLPYPPTAVHDLNRDWSNDLIARTPGGQLWLYPGTAGAGPGARRQLGSGGWQGYNQVLAVGDASGDGIPDVVARTPAGQMWLYPGTGSAALGARRLIGTGWQAYDALVAPGDFNGDGIPDLIARTPAGQLWLHAGSGTGTFPTRRPISPGWQIYDTLTSAGDLTGDGTADLLGRSPSGHLYLYPGNGTGSIGARHEVGAGDWNGYALVRGVPDVTGDSIPDVVGYTRSGQLWVHLGDGAGGLVARRQLVRTGWPAYDTLA